MYLNEMKLNRLGAILAIATSLTKLCLVRMNQKMITKRILIMFRR
jgi:hypothetical protein